uniref:Uncharacterized protein n=1 Tax=Pavo cristatus TaxID=9049 RepID=A0A8C9FXI8_PAVCR
MGGVLGGGVVLGVSGWWGHGFGLPSVLWEQWGASCVGSGCNGSKLQWGLDSVGPKCNGACVHRVLHATCSACSRFCMQRVCNAVGLQCNRFATQRVCRALPPAGPTLRAPRGATPPHTSPPTPPQLYEMSETLLQHFPGPQDKIYALLESMRSFIARRVRCNAQSLEPSNPRDFIDCFLLQMDKEKNNPHSEFTMENLELTALNLFFAGTETISSTLRYGFVLLMKNPSVLGERCTTAAGPLHGHCRAIALQNHCKPTAELLQSHCMSV